MLSPLAKWTFALLAFLLPLSSPGQPAPPSPVGLEGLLPLRVDPSRLQLETRTASIVFHHEGRPLPGVGSLLLVEAGLPVRLRAHWQEAPAAQSEASWLADGPSLRQLSVEEIRWSADAGDAISARGPEVEVRLRGEEGRASYVGAAARRLHFAAPPDETKAAAAPGPAFPAVLETARTGVLILPAIPYDRAGDGMLAGRNIGIYPNEAGEDAPYSVQDNAAAYRPPLSFYRVDQRSAEGMIAGHLTLGALAPPVFPDRAESTRYVPLSDRLLDFLPSLLGALEEAGYDPQRLAVLRGFVSPTERQLLERQGVSLARFTRYQYGDALAIVLAAETEREEKGQVPPRMADLNGDGSVDISDSEMLAGIVKQAMDRSGMYGGLGTAARFGGPGPSSGTPYVHLDLRGFYSPFRED